MRFFDFLKILQINFDITIYIIIFAGISFYILYRILLVITFKRLTMNSKFLFIVSLLAMISMDAT